MDYFERYKKVNTHYGTTLKDHVIEASKQSALRSFLSSPTISTIVADGKETQSIVSIYQKDFFDRTFLLAPDSEFAKIGSYFEHRGHTYLIMKKNDDDIYPNLYGKLCNEDFQVPIKQTRVKVKAHNGAFTYKTEYEYKSIPIVVDVKGYSISDNAILPLTEGRVIIYIKHDPSYLNYIKLNYEFELFNDAYKITDIQFDRVIGDEGYIALSAQKAVENENDHRV